MTNYECNGLKYKTNSTKSVKYCPGCGSAAVSYTHLDVYKRQGLSAIELQIHADAIRRMEKEQIFPCTFPCLLYTSFGHDCIISRYFSLFNFAYIFNL